MLEASTKIHEIQDEDLEDIPISQESTHNPS
jgi:hypothetical protein